MSPTNERREFQAEVKQLLDLMVHSLYSNKDIFLRELISNASDALDKVRFEALTRTELAPAGDLQIRLEPDAAARTLTVADNGVGMSRDEVIQNLGTIARSGTKEFLAAVKQAQRQEVSPELIGQFGVGFYSAFMVADRVTVVTRRAGEATATRWESTGDGTYTIGDGERDHAGTTVTLHLKAADDDQSLRDFTSPLVLRSIVKRYSDFVAYPIKLQTWRDQPGEGGATTKVLDDETLNSMKAIWDRPKAEVTDDEYKEFYRHISHDWHDPLRTIPVRMEGTLEAYALLYLPSKAPFDLYNPEMKRGLQLYVKRVFVMDECRDLMPSHLRFVKGVVDAHDLSLNVSREILQQDRQIQIIRKQLVKKVLATLDELKRDHADDYLAFWAEFGPVLKEGLLTPDAAERDKVLDLVITASTASPTALTSLDDYVARMKDGQDAIYVLTGASKETIATSPLLEGFVSKGYEVLLFADPVDELWLEQPPEFKGKPLKSIGRGEVTPGTEDERKQASEALEDKRRELGDLLACFRVHLQDQVKDVRLSPRLTSSAACLVADEHDLSPRMQRMMEQLGQAPPPVKPILELNPGHALIGKLQAVFHAASDDPRLELYARLLLGQAQLAETGQVPDPAAFTKVLADVMLRGV
ncbi:MAG: molecular chaperone HtpG [Kofleriaceae bacterium]|nr:molecular chaperone HtpG [Myxococcales bacterium]MCB9564746.1 molecular chaperone HtpG [Kofleriaceae bacterium]MCB9572795.1 molecular chaperone HtpG [Kofleriaceae bacterium]